MKKIIIGVIGALFLMSLVMATGGHTIVAGKVYDANFNERINGADVNVTCAHNNSDTTLNTISIGDGDYSVKFSNNQCDLGDNIIAYGYKAGVGAGYGDGKNVNLNISSLNIALGVSNIALIPEFGLLVAGLTIVSAVGIFFFVRRK